MRCAVCGGFYKGARCRRDHSNVDPQVAAEAGPWKPARFGWYGYDHEVGLGEWAVEYTSEAQVLRLGVGTATVCVYGPVVFTTEVPFHDLTDLPGDDDGD